MNDEEEMVTITKKLYERLTKLDEWYCHLEACGIDNADAYSYACETWEGDDE